MVQIEAIAMLGGLPELPTRNSFEPLMPEDGIDIDEDDEVNLDPTTIKRYELQDINFNQDA